jgi:hypothetical protein
MSFSAIKTTMNLVLMILITLQIFVYGETFNLIDPKYIRIGRVSYREAQVACAGKGKQLCSFADYCPGGEGSEPRRGRGLGKDVWAPISDKYNDWVQISDNRLCKRHSKYGYLPAWGSSNGCCNNNEVLCCNDRVDLVYTRAGKVSYRKAQATCANIGKELCSYKAYCPDGEGSDPVRGRAVGKDVWAPISDEFNDWVQLSDNRVCKTHSSLGWLPSWGKSNGCCHNDEILCCTPPQENADSYYTRVGKVSYTKAKVSCINKGKKLCSYHDYCPGGEGSEPIRGRGVGKDVWAAISDKYNDWVQLSDSRVCKRHSSHGYLPPWGKSNGCCHNDEVLCCRSPADFKYTSVGKVSYQDARAACVNKGKELCSYEEYCPGGEGSEPIRGRGLGKDVWAAISNRYNDWVQISDHRVCRRHSSFGFLPNWGMTCTGCCHNEEVLCCTPQDRVERQYTSAGKVSYAKAKAACVTKGKVLCSYKDYCPNGEGSTPLRGRGVGRDVWAAISDQNNDWVQLSDIRVCKKHSWLGFLPSWGKTSKGCCNNNEVLCCLPPKSRSDLHYISVGKVSWSEAEEACENTGKELCSYKDYCPQGEGLKPIRGKGVGKDVWAAISDQYNDWVQLSDYRICKKHSSLGFLPTWGKSSSGCCQNNEVLCCTPRNI